MKPSASSIYSCAGCSVTEEPWKTTVELVFFNHLLHKICSTAARRKSPTSSNLPTFYSWHTLHKHLWRKSLTNKTAKKCDCKCCHHSSKNTQWMCFCSNFIALFWIRYFIIFFGNTFLLWPKSGPIPITFSKFNIFQFMKRHNQIYCSFT